MTSTWCHLNAFRVICYKFSTTVHLYIALTKMSYCCIERCQTLFHWIYDLWTAQTSTQLTVRYRRPCRSLFTRRPCIALTNWNSGWFSSGHFKHTLWTHCHRSQFTIHGDVNAESCLTDWPNAWVHRGGGVNAALLSLINEACVNVCCATLLSSELVGPLVCRHDRVTW